MLFQPTRALFSRQVNVVGKWSESGVSTLPIEPNMKLLRLLIPVALMPLVSFAQQSNQMDSPDLLAKKHETAHRNPAFIANAGQWDDPSLYHYNSGNLDVFIEAEGFTYVLSDLQNIAEMHAAGTPTFELEHLPINRHAFSVRFVNGKAETHSGRGKRNEYQNYFIGNDQSKWKGNVPLYGGVELKSVYSGIDVDVKVRKGAMKYDLVVAPGANPNEIKMEYTGLDHLEIVNGNLVLHTSLGELQETIPVVWQDVNGKTEIIKCNYTLTDGIVGFAFPDGYNKQYPLIIDPVLVGATLSGTSGGSNFGHGATYDIEGNIYTHAISFEGANYPVTTGAFQTVKNGLVAVLTKFNPDATNLIWASYLGGTGGDYPHSIITNAQGELFVYGTTSSDDFPVTPWGFQTQNAGGVDIYVTHFNNTGSALIGSTYLGGSATDGRNNTSSFGHDGFRGEIVLDDNGNAFIATATQSSDFPVTPGCVQPALSGTSDGMVAKFSPNLSTLYWSTFLGGSESETASGLRIRPNGNAVVAGITSSDNFPMPAGGHQPVKDTGYDAYISEISEDGSTIVRGTFAGTSSNDYAFFIDINNIGISIYGISTGDWPVTAGAYDSGGRTFVTRYTNDLTMRTESARIAGQGGSLVAFMVDLCGRAYMSMYSAGAGLTITDDAVYLTGGFYIVVLDENLSDIVFATYGQGSHVDGGTSRFDPKGIIYQGVCSGSGSFVGTPGAWFVNQSVGWDIGVFKIDFGLSTTLAAGATPNPNGCAPHEVQFNNFSTGNTFLWDFGDGSPTSDLNDPTHTYDTPGEYQVMLIAIDSTSCNIADTTFINLQIGEPFELEPEFTYEYNCEAQEITLINSTETGGNTLIFEWDMGDGTSYYTYDASHVYSETGMFEVTLTVSNPLCNEEESLSITVPVYQFITAQGVGAAVDFCIDATVQFNYTGSGADSFEWHFGDGNTGTENSPLYSYAEPGTYDVTLYVFNEFACETSDTTTFQVTIPPQPEVQAEFDVVQTGSCSELAFSAQSLSTGAIIEYVWGLSNGAEYEGNPLSADVEDAGVYELTLIVTEGVCNYQDTITYTFELIRSTGASISPTNILCYNVGSIELDASAIYPEAEYIWTPGGESTPQITVSQTGIYTATITYNNCVEVLTTELKVGQEIPTDYAFESCDGIPVEIAIDFPVVEDPYWVDGTTANPRMVTEATVYPYEFTDHLGCRQFGEITFNPLPDNPQIKIPNIFTPNADGQNDIFQPLGEELLYYSLSVYNRWGKTLFETSDIYGGWNGVIADSNEPITDGNYFYIVRYQGECEPGIQEKSGWVYVSR